MMNKNFTTIWCCPLSQSLKGRLWYRNSTIGQGHRRIRSYMFYIANESADGHFKIIFIEMKNFFFGALNQVDKERLTS